MLQPITVERFLAASVDYRQVLIFLRREGKKIEETKLLIYEYNTTTGTVSINVSEAELSTVWRPNQPGDAYGLAVSSNSEEVDDWQILLQNLDFKETCQWEMKRVCYRYHGVNVYLDNIRGVGLRISLNKLIDSRIAETQEKHLRTQLDHLLDQSRAQARPTDKSKKILGNYRRTWSAAIKKAYKKI
ncbi:MAG: hypothetical protein NUV82_03155 [Candidatus Komeilibacteria bacterium]|nr:hypothetical protein [Candidatus Komeilibacteria bacterium]